MIRKKLTDEQRARIKKKAHKMFWSAFTKEEREYYEEKQKMREEQSGYEEWVKERKRIIKR